MLSSAPSCGAARRCQFKSADIDRPGGVRADQRRGAAGVDADQIDDRLIPGGRRQEGEDVVGRAGMNRGLPDSRQPGVLPEKIGVRPECIRRAELVVRPNPAPGSRSSGGCQRVTISQTAPFHGIGFDAQRLRQRSVRTHPRSANSRCRRRRRRVRPTVGTAEHAPAFARHRSHFSSQFVFSAMASASSEMVLNAVKRLLYPHTAVAPPVLCSAAGPLRSGHCRCEDHRTVAASLGAGRPAIIGKSK